MLTNLILFLPKTNTIPVMKKYILCLSFMLMMFAENIQAQKQVQNFEEQMKDMLLEDKEPMFKRLGSPDKFSKESIVILAQKTKIKFYFVPGGASSLTYIHSKILLNDARAIEEMSDFSFESPTSSNAMLINIIKKDGEVKPLDLSNAVEDEVSVKLGAFNLNVSEKKKKIAIPDLAVGDVIEYISLIDRWQSNYEKTHFLASDYSCVESKVVFEYEPKQFSAAYKSLNGCPEFKFQKQDELHSITLIDTMRPRYTESLEDIASITEPLFKVHIVYNRYNKSSFKFDLKKARTKVTEEDIKQLVIDEIFWKEESANSYYYMDYIKKYGYGETNKEFLTNYFYFMRDREFMESVVIENRSKRVGITMMNKLIKAAKKRSIRYDIVILHDRSESSFEQLFFENELYWGVIFYCEGGEELSFYSFNLFSHPNEIPSEYEGTVAYKCTVGSNVDRTQLKKFNVPVSPEGVHTFSSKVQANFNTTLDTADLKQVIVLNGNYRQEARYDLLNRADLLEEYKSQLVKDKVIASTDKRYFFLTNNAYLDLNESLADQEEKRAAELFRKNEESRIKDFILEEYHGEEYKVFKQEPIKVISDGRDPKKRWTSWEESLKVGNLVKEVSPDMKVLEIGKMLSSMYQINNAMNREVRKKPFFLRYNRTYSISLEVLLPAGYTVKDASAMNYTYENAVGKFTSSATINDNVIKFTIVKLYKAGDYKGEQWKDYLTFLDNAAAVNHIGLIIEKK